MSVSSGENTIMDTLGSWWQRAELWLLASVERFNPILIKETRQALKSRQFVLTFMVTLLACWISTFAVFGIVGPEVFFVASGDRMLFVYCAILAFPLMVVVPYSAYRSIAAEQEDNTYDLLSITSLSAQQIVTGKLGSALVQMLVYLSAVSPCIAFTFILRGVDMLLVAILLTIFFVVSLGESMVALLIGTLAKARHTQALTSVLVVVALFSSFMPSVGLAYSFIEESDTIIRSREFWWVGAALLTLYITTFLLCHAAAAAQIAFPSENRSSPLRRFMMLQQACFVGWMSVIPIVDPSQRALLRTAIVSMTIASGYWLAMGSFLTSEWPHLSRRVQRSLPQSKLGQILLTWFNPGPATGYMFAVANLTAIAGAAMILLAVAGPILWGRVSQVQAIYFVLFAWCYVVVFLGIGHLLIAILRKYFFISMTAGSLIHVILLLMACGIPQAITLMSNAFGRGDTYSLLHGVNPFWTLIEAAGTSGFSSSFEAGVLIFVLPAIAAIVLLLNFRYVAAEIQIQRRSLPERVAEEDAELMPVVAASPASPWDSAGN